jgi:hypothetical protein
MRHLTEEQLVLHYYGDAEDTSEISKHLEECDACRASFRAVAEELEAVKATAIPEPGDNYEQRVWGRLRLELPASGSQSRLLRFPYWVRIAAVVWLVAGAFLAGRFWPQKQPAHPDEGVSEVARDRILLLEVADHLERSQIALLELVHADARPLEFQSRRTVASDLVTANRLYRQTAWQRGEASVATVLEDLERVLLEIANSPTDLSDQELRLLQQRIEDRGILFKVRVLEFQTRSREKDSFEKRDAQSL